MFHVHAWGIPYLATLLGVKQVYPGRYEPKLICWLRNAHDVTFSHCVPTILEMILEAAEQTGTDLTGWKMTIGGAALTKMLCARGRSKGLVIAAGYGMSETGPLVCRAALSGDEDPADQDAILSILTMAGTPFPLVKARVVDEAMNEVPHDGRTTGELVLRAPWLTASYTHDPEGSVALWHGGWLHTQDIATIDHRGRIQIRDRPKDVIKTGGEWIDSLRLEELVGTAKGVREVAVIAVPDVKWGRGPWPSSSRQPTLHPHWRC
jgi:fatty-acyl-CoA synthase